MKKFLTISSSNRQQQSKKYLTKKFFKTEAGGNKGVLRESAQAWCPR